MFEKLRASMGERALRFGLDSVRKYDADWFVRFLKMADEEDTGGSLRVSDPMKQNAWVNLAVNAIAQNLTRAPFDLMRGEDKVETGPVWQLFQRPNPFLSRFQLWEGTVAWRYARGEAIWVFEKEYQGGMKRGILPKQIWLVDPNKMTHTLAPDGRSISMWEFAGGKGEKVPFLPDEIIHFKLWNKWDPWRGVHPLIAMSEELSQDYQANVLNTRIIQNGSAPGGVLSSKQRLTPKDAQDIQERWEKNHKGASRANKIAVLGQDTTYQQTGLTPEEMMFFENKKWTRQTVLALYRVPPAVVGVKDDLSPLSGTDTKEQMKLFWNTRLLPEIEALQDQLQSDFFMRFGLADLKGNFDTSVIQELQDDLEKESATDRAEIAIGLKTINQVRIARGEDAVAWGDTWLVSPFLRPAEILVDEANNPPEPLPPVDNQNQPGVDNPVDDGKAYEGCQHVYDALTAKPIREELALFAPKTPEVKTRWTPEMRTVIWKRLEARWDKVEGAFKKDLTSWFYKQRSELLLRMNEGKAISKDILSQADDPQFWNAQTEELKKIASKHFLEALELEGAELDDMFHEMGLNVGISFDIYNTNALTHVQNRVTKGHLADVTETVRGRVRDVISSGLREGKTEAQMTDEIREVYNHARANVPAVARTELGGVIGDARYEAFQSEGFSYHSWLSAQDDRVRESHMALNEETVQIGEQFSNGLLYPNDPDGLPEETINCRCITLPEFDKEGSRLMQAPEKKEIIAEVVKPEPVQPDPALQVIAATLSRIEERLNAPLAN